MLPLLFETCPAQLLLFLMLSSNLFMIVPFWSLFEHIKVLYLIYPFLDWIVSLLADFLNLCSILSFGFICRVDGISSTLRC